MTTKENNKLKSMTSSVAQRTEANPYVDDGYTYHYPMSTFQGMTSAPPHPVVGHPHMQHHHYNSAQAQAQLNPPPQMTPYYSPPHPDGYYVTTTQYMTQSPVYAAPPAPAPMPLPYHPAQQQMYYGSWPGAASAAPPISQQQMHYPSYQMILPPNARSRGGRSSNKNNEPYGSLELNAFDVENENFASALNFVKRNPKATLFDIDGIIPDIARADEGASRFIQKRLKFGSTEELQLGTKAALSAIEDLWGDHYGNFMLQGIFEFGTPEMKKELMDAIYGQDVVALCLHMHGCRVIQKAIRCLDQEDVCKLIPEFQDKVLSFIHDPNGNHVIQRSIQVMSSFAKTAANSGDPDLASSLSNQMQFIIDDIVADVELLSTHRYGCRVVQRAIEHCVEEQKNAVLEKIIACHQKLATDQYGNYVIQQVMACGRDIDQSAILNTLTENGALLPMSKHKYASNVVESILVLGKPQHKEKFLEEMLKDTRGEDGGYCCVIELCKDSIANYVVSKAIEVSEKDQQENIFEVISSNRQELSKSPYAKYVLQKIDKQNKSQEEA